MNEFLKTVWRSIRQDRLAMAGLIMFSLIVLIALFGRFIATHDPSEMNERTEGIALWFTTKNIRIEGGISDTTLNDIIRLGGSEDAYLTVGDNGFIGLFKAGTWEQQISPVETRLLAVADGVGRRIAVGDAGVIIEDRGDGWEQVQSPVAVTLHAVAIGPDGQAIAVGEQGIVAYSDGSPWQQVETPVSCNLFGVTLPSGPHAYIVGARGTLLQWNGSGVQKMPPLGFRDLYAIDAESPDHILAVGERGTVYHFNGTSWKTMTSPIARTLRSVALAGDRAAAVATHGDLMLLENGAWKRLRSGYDRHFRGVAGDGNQFIAVGTDPYINSLARPSREHFFGTTHNGRDIFSQVVYGTRTALLVALLAALMVTIIGTNVGLLAGYLRGRVDSTMMRIVDIMYALPLEPFAMVLVLLSRPGIQIIILAVGLLTWRTTARIIRSQVLSLANRPFVKAARVAGASKLRIIYVHIAPNVLPLAFLQLAVAMAFAITAEATLSFLGLGPPRVYSWGVILHQARLSGAWREAWWWVMPPGIMIMITVVSVFFISRALEVIANPRLTQK